MIVRDRILIIGNGFDLAHYLPTKYEHFIHVMKVVEEASSNTSLSFDYLYKDFLDDEDFILTKCKELYKTEELEITVKQIDGLKKKLIDSHWFRFFKSQVDSGVDTWIDFENEVKDTLNSVCSLIDEMEGEPQHFRVTDDKKEASIQSSLIREKMFRKHPAISKILWQFNIIEREQFDIRKLTLNKEFVKYYHEHAVYLDTNKIFLSLTKHWNDFIDIFSMYIEYINTFEPRKKLALPKVLSKDECTIYSFNYSSTVERLYNHAHTQFLHGKTGGNKANTIVLGISDLENKILVEEKAYGFVKYYQKLVNNTDYQFLRGNPDITDLDREKFEYGAIGENELIEIYLWGHSLDSSDSDYIEEIFGFNQDSNPSINVIVYYFGSPHAQLANLISIMGKNVIEKWMKEGWLEFVESPDIYQLNADKGYEDKLSKKSEKKPMQLFGKANKKSIFSDI
ncbi:AbiH family protein [Psychrobacter sp. T6-1]|uniref:AbiH family protein n=1 Tax=Psychrobacter sp. T6-1 TaxID=3457447 RepID=UPI003FD3D046